MEADLIENLAKYRMVVGYLGEKAQYGWWQSSFFTQGSQAFLLPIFGRTQTLAQCNGVTQAAALVHDERIGVGHVYHLFRLPEEIERAIHQSLQETTLAKALQKMIIKPETALDYLRKSADSKHSPDVGPIRMGNIKALRDTKTWQQVAGAYLFAFEQRALIFPYITDIS